MTWDGKERRKTDSDSVDLILYKQEEMLKLLEKNTTQIDNIYKAIYIGNGKPSIMNRLDTLEVGKKYVYGILGVIGTSLLGLIITIIKEYIKK